MLSIYYRIYVTASFSRVKLLDHSVWLHSKSIVNVISTHQNVWQVTTNKRNATLTMITKKNTKRGSVLKWTVRGQQKSGTQGAGASPQHNTREGPGALSTLPGRRAHSAVRDNIILINHWPRQWCAVGRQICHNHYKQGPPHQK